MARIRKGTMEAITLAARNVYPNEFPALLSSKKNGNTIDEFVLAPATYGKTFSSIRLDLVPYDNSIRGSAHSHPSPNASPSKGDLRAFKSMGKIHLIIAYPFSFESIRAYDQSGKEAKIDVVE